jgi:hypothetical protein
MSCVGISTHRYTFGDEKGVTGPNRAAAAELAGAAGPADAAGKAGPYSPAGATGPAPCHDSGPGDYHLHKHSLDG